VIEISHTATEKQLRALRAQLALNAWKEHDHVHVVMHHADGQEKHFYTDAARFLDWRIAAAVVRRREAELEADLTAARSTKGSGEM
jgi:hypothetical protein